MRVLRASSAVSALTAVALLATACAGTPGSAAPTSKGSDTATTTPPGGDSIATAVEAAWLDDGRAIAVVTWGSSTCMPVAGDVSAEGQTVSVSLVSGGEKACTDDLAPRAVYVGTPEGVDVTQDVNVEVAYGGGTQEADLDGLAHAPEGPGEQKASAGWFEDGGIALLTWGSSSCHPVIEDVKQSDAGAIVTFRAPDGVCTMDLAPRVTTILLPDEHDDGPFELTLVGDNLDATVSVIG